MNAAHFTDEKIDAIRGGKLRLTPEERAFLLADTPRFEECDYTAEELAGMDDAALMRACYCVWADYVR